MSKMQARMGGSIVTEISTLGDCFTVLAPMLEMHGLETRYGHPPEGAHSDRNGAVLSQAVKVILNP